MATSARFISAILTLALGFLLSPDGANAQAMIGYGHGVAKAAGAGAAVGAGVGGALTGLGNPLADAADRRGGPVRKGAAQRQTVPNRRENITWDVPRQGFGGSAPMALVGGVQANGATDANRQLTLLEPSQNLAVLSASWGGPAAAEPQDSGETIVEQEPAADAAAETPTEAKLNPPVVARSAGQGSASGGESAERSGAVAPSALPEGVVVGAPIEQLLEKLGRPYLSFRGVAGEGYTDQFVFELADGSHLVVYVLDGVVAHIAFG